MSYDAWCAVCGLETTCETLDAVLDLHDDHRAEYGEKHIIEFEKIR